MRQKTAILLALLLAVQTPISAAAVVTGTDTLQEETTGIPSADGEEKTEEPTRGTSAGEGSTEKTELESEQPKGEEAEGERPEGARPEEEPSGNAETEAVETSEESENATPSDALNTLSLYGMRKVSLERTGSLRLELHGVVASQESDWQLELYPAGKSGEENLMEQVGPSLLLPQTEDGVYVGASALFEDIPVGRYDLKLTPLSDEDNSYLPYEQKDIAIGTDLTTIHLMNDRPELHGYTSESAAAKFGVFVMGDINNDQILDENDKDLLMEIISVADHPYDVFYDRADLNGDGKVDLLDMAAFARYYDTDIASRKAKPVKNVRIRADEVRVEATGTQVTGSLTEMIAGETEVVTLSGSDSVISEASPVEVAAEFSEAKTMAGFTIDPVPGSGGSIQNGKVTVELLDGTLREFIIQNGEATQAVQTIRAKYALRTVSAAGAAAQPFAVIAAGGEMLQGIPIVIDLKGQVAVKKITIKVTKTMNGGNLAEISDVEFFGDMADRIPEPPMSVPERVTVDNGNESFTLTWKKMPNVTGYEVTVTGINSKKNTVTDTHQVETAALEVTSLGGADLVNGNTYTVEIRSVNRTWKSHPASVTAAPRAMGLPPAPENLVIQAGYRRLSISWKAMKDTESYTLYYREAAAKNARYQTVSGIKEAKYDLQGLRDETEYEFYLTGTNEIGEGSASLHYTATTISMDPPAVPNYKLINTELSGKNVTAHIESVQYGGDGEHQFDIADGRYDTAWVRNDWDAGYTYPDDKKAPIVTLDAEYEMDTVVVIPDEMQPYELTGATLQYWTNDGKKTTLKTTMRRKVSSNKKVYYTFQTAEPFKARKVQLLLGNTYGHASRISVAEMKFYYYDPIENEIMGLYTDTYHVVLRPEVTLADIEKLRAKLQVKDTVSGEFHPKKAELETELDNAVKILKDGGLQDDILMVDTKDTAKSDGHITFRGGLNTYQPLGVTALAGETLTVYVGGQTVRNGDATRLELILSQYHGSSKAVFKSLGYLKGGPNEITVTALDDMNLERGGQLYVEYTGAFGAEQYGVRVSGGHSAAVLDLSDTDDIAERVRLAKAYLTKVEKQNQEAASRHSQDHAQYGWDPKNCIYEGTDILTRYGMISTAAAQVLAGLGGGSLDAMAAKLEQSMRAFDEMMVLFYQHKGLSGDAEAPAYNRMPVSRINIRYQRMFAGAFMYAGGKHIGIEWPELAGMMGGVPMNAGSDGSYTGTGQYFGWGISHEIGHEINEGAYAVAEITNNYFAVLGQARDTNDSVRFDYDDVFKKVTSGTKGKASNVFVQLAMYWQLHLAYDLGGYNYKTFDDNEEQLENLFFARVDSYVRNPESAPGAEGNELTLSGADTDNKLMRLATAAAQKNLLAFFRRWGLEPDAGTVYYAGQFPEETRGIWFANDESRAVQLREGTGQNRAEHTAAAGTLEYENGSSQVTLRLSSDSSIWMYEVYRYERVKDTIERRPVGYAWAEDDGSAVFTDTIGTINNHTFTYEVIGYDHWLNPTARKEIGSVKVCHDGQLDKSLWEVSTNLTNDSLEQPNEKHPDTTEQPGLEAMIDGRADTAFTGSTEAGTDPEIILHLNQEETITGLSYTAASGTPIGAFEIYVSRTGSGDWQPVTTSQKQFVPGERGSQTVYFHDEKALYTYDASYVRLVAPGQGGTALTVSELSLIGQTGDNIELAASKSIGRLEKEFTAGNGARIPAGSVVFTGTYKGNPAFNAVLLWDENGRLVGGTDADGSVRAEQIIFAPDPKDGLLGEVSEGTWVYYIDPAFADTIDFARVRAELYRVDDAKKNTGERLVSSTLFVEMPSQLPPIVLNAGGGVS